MQRIRSLGPGLLVTAAFIGPGTVTTASRAGAGFGFALAWAILFSVFATITLQQMAARLGLVTRKGLAQVIRESMPSPQARFVGVGLVVSAIVIGNAAYQTGNLLGAGMGLEIIFGGTARNGALAVGIVSLFLLQSGSTKRFMSLLIGIVVAMSLLFIASAVWVRPAWEEMADGLLQPSLPPNSLLTVIALIGTTVVPYNLFLHATSVQSKWPAGADLRASLGESRWDTFLSVALGGVVTLAIMATAATTVHGAEETSPDAAELARQLEPVAGNAAKLIFASGLFAAGLTSSLTAPWAAAVTLASACGWKADNSDVRFRFVGTGVVFAGMVFAFVLGGSPQATILFAQASNGLLLPLVAVFLLFVMNQKTLGEFRNGWLGNLLGGTVVCIATVLGGVNLWKVVTSLMVST